MPLLHLHASSKRMARLSRAPTLQKVCNSHQAINFTVLQKEPQAHFCFTTPFHGAT